MAFALLATIGGTATGAVLVPTAIAGGELDRRFGGDGTVMTKVGRTAKTEAVALHGRKTVVVGWRQESADTPSSPSGLSGVVARYRRDGRLDRTLGSSRRGWKLVPMAGGKYSLAYDVAVQPDGKIVVAGGSGGYCDLDCFEWWTDAVITRLRPNGRVDSSFGSDGRVVLDFGRGDDEATSILVRPDGGLLFLVRSYGVDDPSGWFLVRRLPDGGLDPSFGENGRMRFEFPGVPESFNPQVLQALPDGRIAVVGAFSRTGDDAGSEGGLLLLTEAGIPDVTFGDQGFADAEIAGRESYLRGVGMDGAGRFVAGGGSRRGPDHPGDFALVRFTPEGAFDPLFGDLGLVSTDFDGRDEGASGLVDRAGRFVLAGTTFGKERSRFAVARYNEDGTPDREFGRRGRVVTRLRRNPQVADLTATRRGAVVVAGTADGRLAVARYRP